MVQSPAADYTVWRDHLASAMEGASASVVPEPTGIALLSAVFFIVCGRRLQQPVGGTPIYLTSVFGRARAFG